MAIQFDAAPEELKLFLEEADEHLQLLEESLADVGCGQNSGNSVLCKIQPAEMQLQLDWQEEKQVGDLLDGQKLWQIAVVFKENSEMLPVRVLLTLMSMRAKGEVIKSNPTAEEIEKEEIKPILLVVLRSSATVEELSKAIRDLPDIAEVKVQPFEINKNGDVTLNTVKAANIEENASAIATKKSSRTVRIDVELLDILINLVGELVIDRTRLAQIIGELEARYEANEFTEELGRTSLHIGRIMTMLQEEIMKARMLPVETLFNKFPRMMRDLSQKAGKEIDFSMEGQETELDKSIIEEIGDPLIHLLRNAVDHAIEPPEERAKLGKPHLGNIKLSARHEENHIVISVQDDGQGIDPDKIRTSAVKKGLISELVAKHLSDIEAINLIFASGLSTASKVTDVSGRGVGMDVVRTNLEKSNGSIDIISKVGHGTNFKIKLPLTLAIIRALMVSVDKRIYAIPLTSVVETIRVERDQISIVNKKEAIVVRGQVLPLFYMRELYRHQSEAKENAKNFVVVVNVSGMHVGLVLDKLLGEQEVVIKSMGKYIGDVQGLAGATILGDGRVALIVDVASLMKVILHAVS